MPRIDPQPIQAPAPAPLPTAEGALADQAVLFVDCQTTGATPARGHVLELGWARGTGARPIGDDAAHAQLLTLPEDAPIPRAVARLTGISPDHLVDARAPAEVWRDLLAASGPDLAGQTPLVIIHYARFELRFLRDLCARFSPGETWPRDVLCSHAIAQILLPELPRRGLRALAGYFGGSPEALKRSASHVVATSLVWHHLCALLEARGVTTVAGLRALLADRTARPRRSRGHAYPMDRARRLALPDRPGVYHFLRQNGDLLYVGKARSLARRVNSYFQKQRRIPDRTLEMLTQARDMAIHEVASPLEAALLECEHIQRLKPPYNVALVQPDDRPLHYLSPDLLELATAPGPGPWHGPLRSAVDARILAALRGAVDPPGRDRAVELLARFFDGMGDPPPLEILAQGVDRFQDEYLLGASGHRAVRAALVWLGHEMWRARLLAAARDPDPTDEDAATIDETGATDTPGDDDDPEPGADAAPDAERPWDDGRVALWLARTTRAAMAQIRRGAWLAALAHSSLAWQVPGAPSADAQPDQTTPMWRLVRVEAGAVVASEWSPAGQVPPAPIMAAPADSGPWAALDRATYDRLRVLSTEIRRLASAGADLWLRLGPRRVLDRPGLQRVLPWR